MTLREALQHGDEQLSAGPHPARARLDAEALLLHLTGKSRAWLITHAADPFGGCTATQYAALIQRRLTGEPIQYITGEAEFYGLPFRVTRDVLIPRPETEHLVEQALALAPQAGAPEPARSLPKGRVSETGESNKPAAPTPASPISSAQILDIGTGSGAIAIALAHHLPHARVTAIDLSRSALALAEENAERNGVAIRFLQGDLLAPVAGESFHLIVSNPPYVADADRATLDPEVRDFEPHAALFAGADGLAVYRRLIPAAFAALVPGGWHVLEIGYGQAEAIRAFLQNAGFTGIQSTLDLQGIPRVLAAQRP
jgi:release factor glutamine methyltransferase